MKSFLVVTITCSDRPGIVERVTDVVVTHGGNWEESRLAQLGGDFAGIVMVSVPAERADELTTALASLANDEMTVAVKGTSPVAPGTCPARSAWRAPIMRASYTMCLPISPSKAST